MNLGNTIRYFKSCLLLDENEKYFLKQFISKNANVEQPSGNKLKVLIQMPESYFFLALFPLVLKSLTKNHSLEIEWINVNCEFQRIGKGALLKRNSFFERKWTNLYTSFGGRVAFKNLCYSFDRDTLDAAKKVFTDLSSKDELLEIKYKDIHIGDLVYDTYLRFKPAPTVDLKDEFLETILKSAFQLVKNTDVFTRENKHDYLFTAYCSYIHHGIMTRVALRNKVKVIAFGNFDHLSKKVTALFPSHAKNYYSYKELFEAIAPECKEEFKKLAKSSLEERFQGKNDPSTFYMRQSAFGESEKSGANVFKSTGKKRAVIFLHCFFDSPHVYRYMHYSDFYEWAERTLALASESDFDFYVKAHPNAIEGNVEIVEKLKNKFPKIVFIPPSTSNNQLIKEGFDVAFTVYGTLGHEFPFFGIAVVNAGDNPHINYSFNNNTSSREEYEWFVKNIDKVPPVPANAKDQILEFYYMNNFYKFPGKLSLEENEIINSELRLIDTPEQLKEFAQKCSENSNYQAKIESLISKSIMEVL